MCRGPGYGRGARAAGRALAELGEQRPGPETMRRSFLPMISVGPADYQARFGHINHQDVAD